MAPTWAIAVGSLGGIVVLGLIGICWWFPRTWAKGEAAEMKEFEAAHARPKITFEEALERARENVRMNKGGARVVY
ncbi:hypothetical protein N0V93_008674 [Gnomoniopsis smithogilvyi]|uniref:Uncharacterized protein n=1 Tax=Gnomoniopsis smithogilvyi TaxID=1191159 RepID=A0A9W9CV40_9PEZI|nr:hypothetical protein N0V93_008674 [Gnomoniopsis smithogilvyi]